MKNEAFYISGFWRFVWVLLLVSVVFSSAAMMTIEASLLPIHWNIYGDADQFADKNLALALWPLIILALIGLFKVIPKFEKRKEHLKQSKKATSFLLGGVLLLIFVLQLLFVFYVLGVIDSMMHWVTGVVSVLILVMGNFITKLQSNYSIGIRTKWTLNDERVWVKTHRFASLLFILVGVLSLTTVFWMPPQWMFLNIVVFVLSTVICVPYSYLVSNSLEAKS